MSVSFPLGLRQSLEAGDCVLFVGAGVGGHFRAADGSSAPDGSTLAKELADHFGIDVGDQSDLAKVSQIVEIRKGGRSELETFVKRRLSDLEPDDIFTWIATVRWKAIFTTNYDAVIQRAYAKTAAPPQTPVTITSTGDLVTFDRRFQVPIYHLHGTLFNVDKPRIIITEDDYIQFRNRRRMLFEILKQEFATSTFVYIGYSNRDPNWRLLLEEIQAEFYPSRIPISYRVAPTTDQLDDEILRSKGIETINATFDQFQSTAAVAIAGSRVSQDVLQRLQGTIPPDLLPAFDKYPAAVARLVSSWEYVNQAPFNAKPNTAEFMRGDRANWALVGKNLNFERDIEPELYDAILEYATGSNRGPSLISVLGPAGYGSTTVLMNVSANIVTERAGAVFFHRPGTPLLEGDVEFASSLLENVCPIFVIDNAADHVLVIHNSLYRLRALKRPALFVIGERLNEWRSTHAKLSATEFLLESLSDLEINKLLDCLTTNNALNKLKDLSRDLQFASIKQNYLKELLVAMREATEGKGFDAIIEDEYRGIPNVIGQRLYLLVCCFYQHGAYARDGLLCDLLKVSHSDLYELTSSETEGVVVFEEIDPSYGHFAARARHRTIASVVWERVADAGEKEEVILSSLKALNLNHKTDVKAFENFIRSDRMVDAVRTLEGRINFFEAACQKDPDSPYIRQHYARMLLRSSQPNLALTQIDQALEISDEIRVLHHTKGMILAHLALELDGQDVARKRLAQSEGEFRRCIAMFDRDEYGYQSLAELYVNWARRASTEAETAGYLAKAEGIISEGLRKASTRDGLWIVSAQIQKVLGNNPQYITELERAVRSSPASTVARYILGRAYRKAGRAADALAVLKPIIELNTEEFRAFVEYAVSMVNSGEPYSKAIAVLRMSTLYGFSDPRFIATLSGMLFMNEEFSAAKQVTAESFKREFPAEEAQRIQFRPRDPKDGAKSLQLSGTVAALKVGYAFIDTPGYESFFCHASSFRGLLMRPGMKVRFEPAFSARGAVVNRIWQER